MLSKVSVTSAKPCGPRVSEPLKMTSSIALPRRCFGALLAHAPADRVDDVRLAAAVRTDDADDVVVEVDDRAVDERLEPANLELFDVHAPSLT